MSDREQELLAALKAFGRHTPDCSWTPDLSERQFDALRCDSCEHANFRGRFGVGRNPKSGYLCFVCPVCSSYDIAEREPMSGAAGNPCTCGFSAAIASADASASRPERPVLFKSGAFTLHSGQTDVWKIDCDALTDGDWFTLAQLIAMRVGRFSAVEGVPTGGLKLASLLERYRSESGPVLVVDDVLTTGASMEQQRAGREAIGAVVFARGPVPSWVTPLFRLADASAARAVSSEQQAEVCVCAAIRLDDGRIIRGHRHDDCLQTAIKWQKAGQSVDPATATQGFYTTRERFVDRSEGMALQVAAGRFTERQGVQILFSEDLY